METNAYQDGDEWVINGNKTWNTGLHNATHDVIFARTSGEPARAPGITAFIVPTTRRASRSSSSCGRSTCRRPRHDQADQRPRQQVDDLRRRGSRPAGRAELRQREPHPPGRLVARRGAVLHQRVDQYARERKPFGKPLAANQAIQFPLVELQTQCDMLRLLIQKTAWQLDTEGEFSASDKVSMCNYWANRLCCEAADRAMQVHGGLGYSRHKPFEHIYRHHRRYRITEGAEEIQMRRVAGYMFGFMGQKAPRAPEPATARNRPREPTTSRTR
jgi:alkylation response protein AidB-like acyl-CoA dehydrogenase